MDPKTTKELESLRISQDVVAKIKGAERLVVDLDTGESVAFPEREPSHYDPVSGGTTFLYDPNDKERVRRDSDLAEVYVRKWESKEYRPDSLTAEDYNNVACAYLWLKKPDWKQAYELFIQASQKKAGNNDEKTTKTINENKEKAEEAIDDRPELPIRINLRTYKVLQELRGQVDKRVETASASEIRKLLDQWESAS